MLFNRRDYAAAGAVLDAELHPTQRAHRTLLRGAIQPRPEPLADAVSTSPASSWLTATLRHCPRPLFGVRGARELDRCKDMQDGILVEHWDVIQDEVTQEQSKSGRPMFGASFSVSRSAGCPGMARHLRIGGARRTNCLQQTGPALRFLVFVTSTPAGPAAELWRSAAQATLGFFVHLT